jgi:hypothetical protein
VTKIRHHYRQRLDAAAIASVKSTFPPGGNLMLEFRFALLSSVSFRALTFARWPLYA